MATLISCFKKHGADLSEMEKDKITSAAKKYIADGYSPDKANVSAVEDWIADLETERDDILSQAEKQGWVKVEREKEVTGKEAESKPIHPPKTPIPEPGTIERLEIDLKVKGAGHIRNQKRQSESYGYIIAQRDDGTFFFRVTNPKGIRVEKGAVGPARGIGWSKDTAIEKALEDARNVIQEVEPEKVTPGPVQEEEKVTLEDYGIKATRAITKNGKPVYEVSGNTKPYAEYIKRAGGRWYGPKKVWSFYGNEDPSNKILENLPALQKKEEIKVPEEPGLSYDIGTPSDINVINLAKQFLKTTWDNLSDKVKIQQTVAKWFGVTRSQMLDNPSFKHKPIEEAFEYSIVLNARQIIKDMKARGNSREAIYARLKALYEMQPNLATRTGSSIERQAYSTPVHLAFLAQEFAGVTDDSFVYEPTAGTGMLLTEADEWHVYANEIDDIRAGILQDTFPEDRVTRYNAISGWEKIKGKLKKGAQFDAVVANPPFGSIDTHAIQGFRVSKLEHAIMMDALQAMKDNGRAAFIIGGHNFDAKDGGIIGNQKIFLNWLYHFYNVAANIDIPGEEYSRQGTKFDVRLIVVNGRKKAASGWAPASEAGYQKVDSVDDILPLVREVIDNGKSLVDKGVEGLSDSETGTRGDAEQAGGRPGKGLRQPIPGEGEEAGEGGPGLPEHAGRPPGGRGGRLPEQEMVGGGRGGVHGGLQPLDESMEGTEPVSPGKGKPGRGEGVPKPGRGGKKQGEREGIPKRTERTDVDGILRTGDIDSQLDNLNENDFDSIFSDVAEEMEGTLHPNPPKPQLGPTAPTIKPIPLKIPKADVTRITARDFRSWWQERHKGRSKPEARVNNIPSPPKTPTQAISKAMTEAKEAFGAAFEGLNQLFGGPSLKMGITFDEETYQKAKPSFHAAWEHAKASGYNVKQFVRLLFDAFGSRIQPYVKKYLIEKQEEQREGPPKIVTKGPDTDYQVGYIPKSKGEVVDETLIPRKMKEAVEESLNRLEKEVGDIDDYVSGKLMMSKERLYKSLSADQIDAVALAINNIDRGTGMVIGDQTGVGKGRVAAAIWKYARINKLKPIFFTAKPTLFSDFYRDIADIGYTFNPLIMASQKNEGKIIDKNGNTFKPVLSNNELSQIYRSMESQGVAALGDYDGILSTYSQINQPNRQQAALSSTFNDNMVILDESHKAAGKDSATGNFIRTGLQNARGVVYLSATFAKRPETMPLYYRTDMSRSNLTMPELISAVERGGTPLQEILSNALARVGQMIRREKSFRGILVNSYIDTNNRDRDETRNNNMTEIMRYTLELDNAIAAAFSKAVKRASGEGDRTGHTQYVWGIPIEGSVTTPDMGKLSSTVDRSNFAATVHNAVRQLMFSLKADIAAEKAIDALQERSHIENNEDGTFKIVNHDGRIIADNLTEDVANMTVAPKGRKPFISVDLTMGSFVDSIISQGKLSEGDPFAITFAETLDKHLKRVLDVSIKNPQGVERKYTIDIKHPEFPRRLREMYETAEKQLETVSVIPGSPIDYVKQKIMQAGYNVDEITGRDWVADLKDPNLPTLKRRSGREKGRKKEILKEYNTGKIDALIVNRSGAEGVSAHAHPDWFKKDPRPRIFFGVQAQLNVDEEVQLMGRINRKGQVALPTFTAIYLDVPGEKRPAAVLATKLKKLSANTSANAESQFDPGSMPDMNNSYGDRIVGQWVNNNPLIAAQLNVSPDDGFIKISGRIALQPVEIQREFYEEIEREYAYLIEEMKEMGTYDLEVQDIDFRAQTISKQVLVSGKNENEYFGKSTHLEKLSVVNPTKPYAKKVIDEMVRKRLGDLEQDEISRRLYAEIESSSRTYVSDRLRNYPDDASVESNTRVNLEILKRYFAYLIGETYNINLGDMFPLMRGVLLDIRTDTRGKGNPSALSRTRFIFAVSNSLRKVTIPASKLANGSMSLNHWDTWDNGISDNWDEISSGDIMAERYMITGNLLQGFAKSPLSSKIVRFTTQDGTLHEGILTPLNYAPETSADANEVRVNPDQAFILYQQGEAIIQGQGDILIDHGDIGIARARKTGGIYYLDETLRETVEGDDFESRGDKMWGTFKSPNAAKRAIERIYELGGGFDVASSIFARYFSVDSSIGGGEALSIGRPKKDKLTRNLFWTHKDDFQLTPQEGTKQEKAAFRKSTGELGKVETEKKRAVIPEGPIKASTTGKQRSIFGEAAKEQPDMFMAAEEKGKEGPRLPEGIKPYAGADGLNVVHPQRGDTVWQTSSETGKLEAVRYDGTTGESFDGKIIEKWTWLTGPEKGEKGQGYGRSFYKPIEKKEDIIEEGLDNISEPKVKFAYVPTNPKAQLSIFDFKPVKDEEAGRVPPSQIVRMATTGNIKWSGTVVSNEADVASLLASIRKAPQELFYTVAVDENGTILEIHKYARGTKSASPLSPIEFIGRVLNVKGAKKFYSVHNHPSGSLSFSKEDMDLASNIKRTAKASGLESKFILIGDKSFTYIDFLGDHVSEKIKPSRRKVNLSVVERKNLIKTGVYYSRQDMVRSSKDAIKTIQDIASNEDGILLLNFGLRPVAFVPFIKGRTMADTTKDLLSMMEKVNAYGLVIKDDTDSENRHEYITRLLTLERDLVVQILDVITNGVSMADDGRLHGWRSSAGKFMRDEAADVLGGEESLQISPTTPWYYSQLTNTLEANLPNSGTPGQFRMMIDRWAGPPKGATKEEAKKYKGSFKRDELKWSGLDEWLAGKEDKITKQDVLDYLKANQAEIKEVVKGAGSKSELPEGWTVRKATEEEISSKENVSVFEDEEVPKWEYVVVDDKNKIRNFGTTEQEALEFTLGDRVKPKFSQWQAPAGGENYKEILITWPNPQDAIIKRLDDVEDKMDEIASRPSKEHKKHPEWQKEYDALRIQQRAFKKELYEAIGMTFKSPHYDEPNLIVHIRMADYTGPNGEKILVLKEIQADRDVQIRQLKNKIIKGEKAGKHVDDLKKKLEELKNIMPFSGKEYELALRKMLRYAAENGYDRLAWTTGEQQAELYDLSKQISEIHYSGTNLKAYGLKGETVINQTSVLEEDLPDIIGKEATDRLLAQPKKGTLRSLVGEDLKIGGEGKSELYDKMVPEYLNKYAKKWGAKAEDVTVKIKPITTAPERGYTKEEESKLRNMVRSGVSVHSIPITPSMAESVLTAGQPLFSIAKKTIKSEKDIQDLQKAQRVVSMINQNLKRMVPAEILKSVEVKASPFLKVNYERAKKSLKDHGYDLSTMSEEQVKELIAPFVAGRMVWTKEKALVEVATSFDDNKIANSVIHEPAHLVMEWLMTDTDYRKALEYYEGNKETFIEDFVKWARKETAPSKLPGWLKMIFAKIRAFLVQVRKDVFGVTSKDEILGIFDKMLNMGYKEKQPGSVIERRYQLGPDEAYLFTGEKGAKEKKSFTTYYHGTDIPFTNISFGKRKSQGIWGKEASKANVIFLAENRKDAEFFSQWRGSGEARIIEVPVPNDAKILELSLKSGNKRYIEGLELLRGIDEAVADSIDEGDSTVQQELEDPGLIAKLKEAGYDGVRFDEAEGHGITLGIFNEDVLSVKSPLSEAKRMEAEGVATVEPGKAEGGNPFKESVVQNVVYHGTDRANIEESERQLIWASYNREYAREFADGKEPKKIWINAKNPLDASSEDWLGEKTWDDWDTELTLSGIDTSKVNLEILNDRLFMHTVPNDPLYYFYDLLPHTGNNYTDSGLIKAIKEAGYDSIIAPPEGSHGIRSEKNIVVFSSDQIKILPNSTRPPESGGQVLSLDLPTKPIAIYLGVQEDPTGGPGFNLYNIIGGERHGSTVSEATLKKLGIPIPERESTEALSIIDSRKGAGDKAKDLATEGLKKLREIANADQKTRIKEADDYFSKYEGWAKDQVETAKDLLKAAARGKKGWEIDKPDTTRIERFLQSAEFYWEKVPAAWRVFEASLRRVDRNHELYNRILNKDEYIMRFKNLKHLRPKEYDRLAKFITKADMDQVNYTLAQLKEEGFSDLAVSAWDGYRKVMDTTHDLLMQDMIALIKKYEKRAKHLPDIVTWEGDKKITINLKVALARMGRLKGFYAPRQRKPGQWAIIAKKDGANPWLEFRDTETFANRRADELRAQGYTVTQTKSSAMPEDVFAQLGKSLSVQALMNRAIEKISKEDTLTLDDFGLKGEWQKGTFVLRGPTSKRINDVIKGLGGRYYRLGKDPGSPRAWMFDDAPATIEKRLIQALAEGASITEMQDMELVFAQALTTEVANIIKGRGFRSSMIKRGLERGEDVWLGYETDPLRAMSMHAMGIAAGIAKKEAAIDMWRAVTGTDLDPDSFENYKAYQEEVKKRRIDPAKQQNIYHDVTTYMDEVLRNQEIADRIIGAIKGICVVKYLGFRVASAAVNFTSLMTSVPASMHGYAKINFMDVPGALVKAFSAYRDYSKGNMADLDPDVIRVLDTIHEKGWHSPQFNKEALAVLNGTLQGHWQTFVQWSMYMFGKIETLNRVSTILGTYIAMKEKGGADFDHQEAVKVAKRVSDKGHGIYGRETTPYMAQGSNPAAQAVKMFYVFSKFSHTYLQNMYQLGFKEKDRKALLYMLLSPAVLAGAGALPVIGKPLTLALGKLLGSLGLAGGVPDEGEEGLYAWIMKHLGTFASSFTRHGLLGAGGYGVSLKGSLAIDVGANIPLTIPEFLGAPASVGKDFIDATGHLARGNIYRAGEKAAPTFIGNPMKIGREYQQGLTTDKGVPKTLDGERMKPTVMDVIYKVLSFTPAHYATMSERKWGQAKTIRFYQGWRSDIYENARYLRQLPETEQTDAMKAALVAEIQRYNERVKARSAEAIDGVSMISGQSLTQAVKQKR